MVTKTIRLRFNIPDSIYRFRWKNVKAWLNHTFFPVRCVCCHREILIGDLKVGDSSLKVNWHLRKEDQSFEKRRMCQHCLATFMVDAKPLPAFGNEWNDYDTAKSCSICKKKVRSYKHFKVPTIPGVFADFRFCTIAWNHDHVCIDCVKNALRGTESGSYYISYRKNNRSKTTLGSIHGLPIVDGKARLL